MNYNYSLENTARKWIFIKKYNKNPRFIVTKTMSWWNRVQIGIFPLITQGVDVGVEAPLSLLENFHSRKSYAFQLRSWRVTFVTRRVRTVQFHICEWFISNMSARGNKLARWAPAVLKRIPPPNPGISLPTTARVRKADAEIEPSCYQL